MAGGDLVTWEQLCEDDDNVLGGGKQGLEKNDNASLCIPLGFFQGAS